MKTFAVQNHQPNAAWIKLRAASVSLSNYWVCLSAQIIAGNQTI
jgi:hypothetical protein